VDQTQPPVTDRPVSGDAPEAGDERGRPADVRGPGVVTDSSDAAAVLDGGARRLSALVVDWGGVLTPPLDTAMTSWARRDGVDFEHFADVMRGWVGAAGSGPVASGGSGDAAATRGTTEAATPGGVNGAVSAPAPDAAGAGTSGAGTPGAGTPGAGAPGAGAPGAGAPGAGVAREVGGSGVDPQAAVGEAPRDEAADPLVIAELEGAAQRGLVPASPVHALERGEISIQDFERMLASALGERGSVVAAEGLLARVLSGLGELRDDMLGLVRRARSAGIRTALLSNSWGEHYPEELWEGAFDVVVISGRVGMRKPDEEIFRHTASLLGVPAGECVMVDDMAGNIHGAVAAGMVGVLHKSYEETAEELEILFDRRLRQ
jgi:HAD superfamily hydrolase (TIGR01509 family)